ncbi:DNA glycosylase [Leucogyrophana mollusca]|uniref:DNA glycosylase n=1 Tax=Leucogyrophana mollusca TaxID=85980 RepID=A0ACB8BB47_9AGAM|nr:DNA glycosylase [Leucogyrophana mollusca]
MATLETSGIKLECEQDDYDHQVKTDFRASLLHFAHSGCDAEAVDSFKPLKRSARFASGLVSKPQTLGSTSVATIQALGKRKPKAENPSKPPSKKAKRSYAAPEVYAHLDALNDGLKVGLDVVFSGINPGYMSAQKGHHFANPTNHFWRCLHGSGLTSRRLQPSEDSTLPDAFNLGLTNLVDRPSAEAAELSKAEMKASVPTLLAKIARYRPRFLCFVGMGIWEIVKSALVELLSSTASTSAQGKRERTKKVKVAKSVVGLQPFKLVCGTANAETLIFVVPSTSGRVTQYQLTDKIEFFADLKRLVDKDPSKIDTSAMLVVALPSTSES